MPSRQITCNVKPHFAEIRKILWKCYLLNMLSAWRFNLWHGSNTFCCHVDAFCYLISDQVATTCYLWKKLISNTGSNAVKLFTSIHWYVIILWISISSDAVKLFTRYWYIITLNISLFSCCETITRYWYIITLWISALVLMPWNYSLVVTDRSLHCKYQKHLAGLGGSVGCAIRLETRRSRVQPPPRSATFFHGDWSWNIFYGHSLPSADSRRAVVSFWRKNAQYWLTA